MLDFFTAKQANLIAEIDELVASGIAQRASTYDVAADFPTEDIRDLHRAGLLLCTLPASAGGLGFGFHGDDPLSFFLLIERIAKGNPSTAHCFQVHCNEVQMVHAFAEASQLDRLLEPTRSGGYLFTGAGSEPGGGRASTTASPTPGGVRLTGTKHYATNATHSKWIMVHAKSAHSGLFETLAVDSASTGLTIDTEFWNPTGMRACVSPVLKFNECFIPQHCVLGKADGFFSDLWLAKINFGFTANYLGAIQALYEGMLDYLKQRPPVNSEIYFGYIGELKSLIDASRLLFYRAVQSIPINEHSALLRSNEAKWMAVSTAYRTMEVCGQLMGSTSLFRKYPFERICRDLAVHLLHRRHHVGAQIVGQAELGQPYDLNKS